MRYIEKDAHQIKQLNSLSQTPDLPDAAGKNTPASVAAGENTPASVAAGKNTPVSVATGKNTPVSVATGENTPVSVDSAEESTRAGAYEAYEGDSKVAEFFWQYKKDGRLFLQSIRFEQGYETYHYFEQIMEFIRYKAHAVGQDAVYAEVAIQNYILYEHLKRFGFYAIDQCLRQGKRGKQSIIRVMKYTV